MKIGQLIQQQTVIQFKQRAQTMIQQVLQQLQTVQTYISALFDSLPSFKISVSPIQIQTEGLPSNESKQLLQQNINYGRKIIQLSDKFTAKYRKDHFVDRKDAEDKIAKIYRFMFRQDCDIGAGIEEMLAAVLRRLEDSSLAVNGGISRSSYDHNYLNVNSKANSVNYAYFGLKDSKLQYYRDQAQEFRHQLSQPQRLGYVNSTKELEKMTKSKLLPQTTGTKPAQGDSQFQKRKRSTTNKSRVSKKGQKQEQDQFTTKTVLQIKTYFQQQEQSIRKLFSKLQKFSSTISGSTNKNSSLGEQNMVLKISQENGKYKKIVDQSQKQNLKDFVQANIQNSVHNVNKAHDLVQLVEEFYMKKGKIEAVAQAKFAVYVQQINKREEVFSFAVSRILENLGNLKNIVEKDKTSRGQSSRRQGDSADVCLQIISNLQQISHNFYDLYPSHNLLKDLKISQSGNHSNQFSIAYTTKQLQKIGYKHEGVQVSLGNAGKNEKNFNRELAQSKRNLLDLFKTQVRVNQMIQKFERATKHKKNIDLKQLQKFIESIRQSFPKKPANQIVTIPTSISNQVQSYQEQLRKMLENSQKNEKQMTEQFNKKVKKYDKSIQDLEKTIESLIEEHKKQLQKVELTNKKQNKKLEAEKQQNKKILGMKNSLQKNIKQMSAQISKLQRQIKDQDQKFETSEKLLIGENKNLLYQVERQTTENKKLIEMANLEKNKFEEQRQIYHQKIIFLESQQQTRNEELAQIREQLQEMIKENTILKKQIEELTEIYEDKIKQLQELIQNIKELEDQLKDKNLQNMEIKENLTIHKEKVAGMQKQVSTLQKQKNRLENKLKDKEGQAEKYKQLGVLNQSDINILKQQMQKVKQAYIESEEQLEYLREYTHRIQSQKEFLVRENRNYKKQVEGYNNKNQQQQLNKQKQEKLLRQSNDELSIKTKQLSHCYNQIDDLKREIAKLKKQLNEARETGIKAEGQVRVLRQQLSKKAEVDTIQLGKRKLELQATKVQLRRKTEQLQKMKESYEQKIEVLDSKNKQLAQFITQKQLLTKIVNSHLSQ